MGARKTRTTRGGARRGAGRPPLFKDRVRLVVYLERKDHEELQDLAETREEAVGTLVRDILERYLKRRRR